MQNNYTCRLQYTCVYEMETYYYSAPMSFYYYMFDSLYNALYLIFVISIVLCYYCC